MMQAKADRQRADSKRKMKQTKNNANVRPSPLMFGLTKASKAKQATSHESMQI
jgi:hypothetical protein